MRAVSIAVGLALGLAPVLAPPPVAAAAKPTRVAPEKKRGKGRREARRLRDFSEGGSERGDLEFGLAAVVSAVTIAVIGRGIWELVQAKDAQRQCDNGAIDVACSTPDPARGNRVAGGLSLGFAVPLGVAAGWLFARALRTRRDHRAWHREHPPSQTMQVLPSAGPQGAGVALRVRF